MSGPILYATPASVADVLSRVEPSRLEGIKLRLLSRIVVLLERNIKQVTPVRTGNLRRSIHGEVQSSNRGVIGTSVYYAPYAHAHNPFMERGAENSIGDVNALMDQAGQELFGGSVA